MTLSINPLGHYCIFNVMNTVHCSIFHGRFNEPLEVFTSLDNMIILFIVSDLFDSAHLEWNLDGLLDKVWEYLDLTRIYTKPKGMNPDYEDPVILSSKRRTVEDFCSRIHKDMLKQFK